MVTPFEDFLSNKKLAPFVKYLRKREVLGRVDKELTPAIKSYVKASLPKQLTAEQISELVISQITKHPPQIIKKTIKQEIIKPIETIRETIKEDGKLKKQLDDLKEELNLLRQAFLVGGSGVIGLPTLEGNNGKILQVVNNRPTWATSSSGGLSQTYTVSNVTTTRTFDASNTSLNELANVLGTLIADLKG